MNFTRSFIRDGDTTTTGGVVHARPQQWPVTYGHDAKHACFDGDSVFCPACKHMGKTQCVMPYRPHTGPDGRQANLDGDLCICKCPVPPRLVAKHHDMTMGFDEHEITRMHGASGWLAYAGHVAAKRFDEQVGFSTSAETMEGVPVWIEMKNGRTISGYLGNDGVLPRIEMEGEDFYHVYWGNEALSRMEGEGQ